MTTATEVFVNPSPISVADDKPKSINLSKIFLYVLIFVTVGYGLFLAVIIASSYTGFQPPLIPKNLIRMTDSALATVPFLPKTPKQVLTRSFVATDGVKSGEVKFQAEITSFGIPPAESIAAKLALQGPFNEGTGDSANFNFDADLDIKYAGLDIRASASLIGLDKLLYFNLKKYPGLESMSNKWYKLDIEKAQKEFGTNTNQAELQEDYKKERTEFLETLEENKILNKVQQLSDEEVGGVMSYHYKLDLTEEEFKDLLGKDGEDVPAFIEFGKVTVEVWVSKDNNYMNKFNVEGSVAYKIPPLVSVPGQSLNDVGLKYKLSGEVSKINEQIEIKAPEKSEELKSLYDLLLQLGPDVPMIFGTASNPYSQVLGITSPAYGIGKALLSIEKTVRNLHSLPKLVGQ